MGNSARLNGNFLLKKGDKARMSIVPYLPYYILLLIVSV